jgi:anti-sigma regulatory factor (Ser/Thr protein kinase)
VGKDDLVASAAYQPEPTAAAAARRFVRETLQAWVVTGADADGHGLVDDAVLLTSELVTNAVVHAGTPVQVTCKLADGEVEVVVSDCHPDRLVPEPAESEHSAAERTGGRGLLLPAALASAWGVTYGRAAKAVWFRLGLAGAASAAAFGNGLGTSLVGEFEAEMAGGTALAVAFRSAGAGDGGDASPPAHERDEKEFGITNGLPAGPRYQALLAVAADSAREAVAADGSCVLMADEDGDLRLQATAGSMPVTDVAGTGGAGRLRSPLAAAPSVLTVPFIVDGRVTGLLGTVSAQPGRFGDAETATLQRLADTWGPRLQRAWLDELDRARRGRIGALAVARGLLAAGLGREEIMALAGRAVVPRLAPWCAVLLPDADARPRLAYARHYDDARTGAVTRLLERACEAAPSAPAAADRVAPWRSPAGWRWRLDGAAVDPAPWDAAAQGRPAGRAGMDGPPGQFRLAWCFPVGEPWDGQSLLVIGTDRGERLSREVAALASDLAARIGLALESGSGSSADAGAGSLDSAGAGPLAAPPAVTA